MCTHLRVGRRCIPLKRILHCFAPETVQRLRMAQDYSIRSVNMKLEGLPASFTLFAPSPPSQPPTAFGYEVP